jgi:hypothetical protein
VDVSRWLAVGTLASCLALLGATAARAQSYRLLGAEGVYTLVNLHADGDRLTSLNYQTPGLIPLCSKVRIVDENRKGITLVVESTGRQYVYQREKHLRNDFHDHLDCYFGTTCNTTDVETLSEIDQQGIRAGRALPGMSKQGVVYAIGYPPDHSTASTAADTWIYWASRWNKFVVHFRDGFVSQVRQ